MINENFIYLGFALQMLGGLSYLVAVLRGKAKPNRITWFLWAAAPMIAFAAELDNEVGIEALFTLSVGLSPLLIFVASFVNKKSYWKLTRVDWAFGGLAVIGIVLWQLTGEANIAIFFAILADGLAAVPTILKSYKEPESENSTIFGLCIINAVITLLVIDVWDFAHYGFPVYILLVCSILFTLIQFKIGPKLTSSKGDGGLIARQQAEKKENKRKIREFMQGKDTITNNEVEKLLGVSNATAERYLDELEKEGTLEQVGKIGRSVHYRIKSINNSTR